MRVSVLSFLRPKEKACVYILFASISFFPLSPWSPVLGVFLITILFFKRIERSVPFLLLLFTWIMYGTIGMSNGNTSYQMAMFFLFPSLLFFNLGSIWVGKKPTLYFIMIIMASVIIALAIDHILVTMYDITQVGLVNPDRILSVLGENAQRSVTQRTVELSMCIGSIGLLFHKREKSTIINKITLILLLFSTLAVLCSLHYVSRTGIGIMFISVVASMAYEWRISIKSIIMVITAFFAFSWIQSTELFSVYSARETDMSNISNFGLRLPRWEWAWDTMISHPWGDSNYMLAEHPYAHNFWLDIGKNCGVLPFIMMCIFSIMNLVNVYKIILKSNGLLTLLVMLWTLACYISLFTEPIHEGAPAFMFVYFFYCGVCYKTARCNILTE